MRHNYRNSTRERGRNKIRMRGGETERLIKAERERGRKNIRIRERERQAGKILE